jgi:GT2 family glycosyltransferase
VKADVVVVAYRSEEEIEACLAALATEPDVASVTVVDNGDGASAAEAERLGASTIREPGNPGFGAGVNRGAAVGTAEALLVLNPDAILQPGAVALGLERLEREPMVAAVQGAIVNSTTGKEERSAGRELGLIHLLGRLLGLRALLRFGPVRALSRRSPVVSDHVDRRPTEARDVETLAATAIVIRRGAFAEVGGFDERYFLYGEDLDLCRRFRDASWRLVATPETWAVHQSGASASTRWDRELSWWQGTLQFARSHWRGWRRIAARLIGLGEAGVLIARAPGRRKAVVTALITGSDGPAMGTERP